MFACLMLAFMIDQQLIEELNRMRSNPARYATHLEERLKYYQKKILRLPNQVALQTKEGDRAVKEAIRVLRATQSLPQLKEQSDLAAAARDHVREIGPKGLIRHARIPPGVGEVMSFGPERSRDVVIELLVDDGVPNRGHRKLLLDSRFRYAGAACGPHKTYRTMCVIDLSIGPDPMPASPRQQ
ncbi:MAG TPA: CAP domain-containing protein [Bryobacteraceae bacterium]|nr:CAP domain-containing protein [Bryobacteraceae bacterium]